MEEGAGSGEGPYQEPESGTVDDRHSQKLALEEQRAGRLVDETGGDVEEAEARFEAGDTVVDRRP